MISGKTSLLAVLGNPITHSLSPKIHNAMLRELSLDYIYFPLSFNLNELSSQFSVLKQTNLKGFNVTVPYKEAIVQHLDLIDDNASRIGAVNTVLNINHSWKGFNTDLDGFVYSLETFSNYRLKGKKVVCIGAGGSAKAVCIALLNQGVESLVIINRTENRLADLQSLLLKLNVSNVKIESYLLSDDSIYGVLSDSDLIINTTPIGMSSFSKESVLDNYDWVTSKHFFYDLIYSPEKTSFLLEAESKGAKIQNGLAMLVAQAAFSFELFTGVKASFDYMFNELK